MAAINKVTGDWVISDYEKTPTTTTGKNWGFIYRSSAPLNPRIKELGDELNKLLKDSKSEMDNPHILAKLSAVSSHYNGARQAQSSLMKSIKDTSQSIIRNM